MILDLPATTTEKVSKKLVSIRETGGAVTLGRVLTLVVCAAEGQPTEGAIDAANDASREHPCRVIVVSLGNPAAVVPLAAWWPDDLMARVAEQHNLSETAFLVPVSSDTYRIRWFSPLTEIDFCGHATLAAALVCLDMLGGGSEVRFLTERVGELRVKKLPSGLFEMDFPRQAPAPVSDVPAALMRGLPVPPRQVLRNRQAYFAVYDDQDAVTALQPDLEQLRQLASAGWQGPVVVVGSVQEARALLAHGRERPRRDDRVRPRARVEGLRADRPDRPWLMLDPDRQTVRCQDAEEPLTRLEFGFLRMLLEQPGRVREFADLTDGVWGTRYLGDVSQVHSLCKRLRRKLDAMGSPLQVQAVRGVGFRMVRQ